MDYIMGILQTIIIVVLSFSVFYKVIPFKQHKGSKPKFTFFPKYIAKFDKPIDEIESTLVALEFIKNDDDIYSRGKVYGDFSAKSVKLSVVLNGQSKEIKVYASFLCILFDTGDIWQLTSDIVAVKQS